MSYDLEAYRLPADLTEKARTLLLEEGGEDHALPLTPEERLKLADALQAVDPSVERHERGGEFELGDETMQVFVDESGVTMNLPYHGSGAAMERAFAFADVLTAHGLTVWDPQSDSIVGADSGDRDAAADRFAATSGMVEQLSEPPPPRWKFWKR